MASKGEALEITFLLGKKRRIRIQGQVTQLNIRTATEISEYEIEEEDINNTGDVGNAAVKHAYRDETWS